QGGAAADSLWRERARRQVRPLPRRDLEILSRVRRAAPREGRAALALPQQHPAQGRLSRGGPNPVRLRLPRLSVGHPDPLSPLPEHGHRQVRLLSEGPGGRFLAMTAWRSLVTALRHPATASVVPRLGRRVLLEPRIFDVVSCFLQLRDARAAAKIREDRPRDAFYAKVIDYNAGVTERKVVTTTRRAEIYYQTLALPPRDTSAETLLIVGPRNVHELLIAWLYGYRWKNIQAIDLYSTDAKIRVMNMEAMTFQD